MLLVALVIPIIGLDLAMNDTKVGSVVVSSTLVTEFTIEKEGQFGARSRKNSIMPTDGSLLPFHPKHPMQQWQN